MYNMCIYKMQGFLWNKTDKNWGVDRLKVQIKGFLCLDSFKSEVK